MHIGTCELRLRLHQIDSLKAKRGICKNLVAQLRNRFNVSVSEVEHLDSKEYLGLGIGAVSSSRAVIDQSFMRILEVLSDDRRFEVEDYSQTYL